MKRIKRIEVVSLADLPKAKVIQSLANLWAVDVGKGKTKYEGDELKFSYSDRNGELATRTFRGMVFSNKAFNDGFSDTNILPVKIHYRDGSWEYGLKWWQDKDVVYQRNRKLVSLFVKSGYVNDYSEEIEDAAYTDKDSRVPAWILDLLPRYNEKIRDAVNGVSHDGVYPDVPIEDWESVKDVVESGYVTSFTKYSTVKLKRRSFKAPVGLCFNRHLPWQAILTTWKDNVCVNEFGIQNSKMIDHTQCVVTVYSYLKSIYDNIHQHRKVYSLIPISDLLCVTKENYARDDDHPSGHWIDDEVWNNLDQTMVGNV